MLFFKTLSFFIKSYSLSSFSSPIVWVCNNCISLSGLFFFLIQTLHKSTHTTSHISAKLRDIPDIRLCTFSIFFFHLVYFYSLAPRVTLLSVDGSSVYIYMCECLNYVRVLNVLRFVYFFPFIHKYSYTFIE